MGPKRLIKESEQRQAIQEAGVWFIDIPRTSTTSIRTELAERYGNVYAKANDAPSDPTRLPSHLPARKVRDFVGPGPWEQLFTFTIIRNPWARIYSLFCWSRNHGYCPGLSFDDYLLCLHSKYRNRQNRQQRDIQLMGNADYIHDEDGTCLVDVIVRYENRQEDLRKVVQQLHIPRLGTLKLNRHVSPELHYKEVYSREGREIVGEVFTRDRELFGYTFENEHPSTLPRTRRDLPMASDRAVSA